MYSELYAVCHIFEDSSQGLQSLHQSEVHSLDLERHFTRRKKYIPLSWTLNVYSHFTRQKYIPFILNTQGLQSLHQSEVHSLHLEHSKAAVTSPDGLHSLHLQHSSTTFSSPVGLRSLHLEHSMSTVTSLVRLHPLHLEPELKGYGHVTRWTISPSSWTLNVYSHFTSQTTSSSSWTGTQGLLRSCHQAEVHFLHLEHSKSTITSLVRLHPLHLEPALKGYGQFTSQTTFPSSWTHNVYSHFTRQTTSSSSWTLKGCSHVTRWTTSPSSWRLNVYSHFTSQTTSSLSWTLEGYGHFTSRTTSPSSWTPNVYSHFTSRTTFPSSSTLKVYSQFTTRTTSSSSWNTQGLRSFHHSDYIPFILNTQGLQSLYHSLTDQDVAKLQCHFLLYYDSVVFPIFQWVILKFTRMSDFLGPIWSIMDPTSKNLSEIRSRQPSWTNFLHLKVINVRTSRLHNPASPLQLNQEAINYLAERILKMMFQCSFLAARIGRQQK
jgi:hypothetical protein